MRKSSRACQRLIVTGLALMWVGIAWAADEATPAAAPTEPVAATSSTGDLKANSPHREQMDDPPMTAPAPRVTTPGMVATRGSYRSIQVNVTADGNNIVGDAANEPSITVDPNNPSRMAIGWRQFDTIASNFRQAGWGYTFNGGQNWTFPGVLIDDEFSSDPVLDTDANGNFYYYALQSERGPGDWACYLYRSTDGGQTFPQEKYAWGGDKNWLTVDRSGGIGNGNVYLIWSSYFTCCDGHFSVSRDGGLTFSNPIMVPREPMWGTLTVGPDGAVYAAGYDFWSSEFAVAKSSTLQNPAVAPAFDFGRSVNFGGAWSSHDGPNPDGLLAQVWVACDHSTGPHRGNVYMMCSVDPSGSDPLDVMFVRSTDGGSTWSNPLRVNDDAGTSAWQWFPTMSVAPNGRIDAVWNDTRNTGSDHVSELHYASSNDGGATWSANIAVSPSFDSHIGWPDQNKIGDYYGLVSDNLGANVAYSATFNGEQDVYYLRIGPRLGDVDLDDDLDLRDFSAFQACFAPGGLASGDCQVFDFNADNRVDMGDFAPFAATLAGPK